jgi:primosomal protein N' (replication factor Y) (superfamily II helicase)
VQATRRRSAATRAVRQPAAELPVARVAVDISLPHLDRPFDYLVPATMADSAVPGAQVRVRFAGQLTSGFVLERRAESDHEGRLGYLERVVAAEPVLTPEIARLARAVADRYGGTLADVLRLAIPPRHAAASRADSPAATPGTREGAAERSSAPAQGVAGPTGPHPAADASASYLGSGQAAGWLPGGTWDRYIGGRAYLAALADGRSPRAVWSALPGPTWPVEIADAVEAVTRSGRGAVVVVPDGRDLHRVDSALASRLGPGRHVVLAASLGPAERYRRWIALARGEVTVVAGTRSAMFAPVRNLGLVVLWDEGDDLHAEPRAPYPHAREVLAIRAYLSHSAALIAGFARTAEAALLVTSGWARPLAADRPVVREFAPAVQPAGGEAELARDEAARSARLPLVALRTARAALDSGPVLIQVPRHGYLVAVACERCHATARCDCGGPAQLAALGTPLRCGWCGSAIGRGCRSCGHEGLRALVTGARRTAEELGRAFGTVAVRTSGGSTVLDRVGPEPAIVVSTPGAEPAADGGYSAAILLDGWALLGLASLRAAEEALRRWMNAAALVRPAGQGGAVVVVADSAQRAVQALVRWDPATFADRELAERAELRFPPAARMAAITGPPEAVTALLAAAELPATAELLGPLPIPGNRGSAGPSQVRFLARVARPQGGELALALRRGQAARSAAKEPGAIRVQLDPAALI